MSNPSEPNNTDVAIDAAFQLARAHTMREPTAVEFRAAIKALLVEAQNQLLDRLLEQAEPYVENTGGKVSEVAYSIPVQVLEAKLRELKGLGK